MQAVFPEDFYKDCQFDACHQENATDAVCTIVKAYAKACMDEGIILDWRRENFCRKISISTFFTFLMYF